MTSKRVRAVRKSRKTLSAGRWVLTTLVAIIALTASLVAAVLFRMLRF